MKKNGANGMNFCLFRLAHNAPKIHETINATARPFVPSHSPPTPSNFISPMPIGVSVFLFVRCMCVSNIQPIIIAIVYPNVAPIMALCMPIGNE